MSACPCNEFSASSSFDIALKNTVQMDLAGLKGSGHDVVRHDLDEPIPMGLVVVESDIRLNLGSSWRKGMGFTASVTYRDGAPQSCGSEDCRCHTGVSALGWFEVT